jgi:phosphoglycolate phosphatase
MMLLPPAPVTAVIFDLDGTLIDSANDIAEALNIILQRHGRRMLSRDHVVSMIGDGAPRLLERGFAATGPLLPAADLPAVLADFVDIYEDIVPDPACLYSGVLDTLAGLAAAGLKLGICTNKPHRPMLMVLKRLGIDRLVPVAIGGDALPVRKPDPGHVRAVMSALGADPDGAVMVGDSAADIAVARNAGIRAAAVSYGYPRMPVTALGADVIIDHFADLPAALRRLEQLD